jgi:hypothetical protein
MPAPTDAELIALIELVVSIHIEWCRREDTAFAAMFTEQAERLKPELPKMTRRQLESVFKDASEFLFSADDAHYVPAMDTIREHGLEPAFSHMVAKKHTRVLSKVLSRGSIRNATEAHAVKSAVDDQSAPGLEASDLRRLAHLYELYIARH